MYSHTSYSDGLAQKRRRRFFIRLYLILGTIVLVLGASIYSLFYSGWLDITSVSISGFKTTNEGQLSEIVRSAIEKKGIPLIGKNYGKNIYFFDPEPVKEDILAQFPIIKRVFIEKSYPHDIKVDITERAPVGIWCFTTDCSYFDEDGVIWGKAMKSSGSLLLIVEDERSYSEYPNRLDGNLLKNIKEVIIGLEELNIKTSRVVIKEDSIHDFNVYTASGYYIILNWESSAIQQTEILKIFLTEKGRDFKPLEYIDLSIEGRVYYK